MKLERWITSTRIKSIDLDDMRLRDFAPIEAEYGSTYTDLRLESEYYGYDGGKDWYLVGDRSETDEELQLRQDAHDAANAAARKAKRDAKKAKDAKELAEYERLKAKFG